jgi:hypothetical protein
MGDNGYITMLPSLPGTLWVTLPKARGVGRELTGLPEHLN